MKKKIFIDAGHNHSGWNTGAAANGMREQDITFDVAFELGRILGGAGFDIRLSRPTLQTNLGTDNASAINARWQASNAWGADYFVSVHANAGGGTGAETLYHREDSLKFATVMQNVYSEAMGLRNRRVWRRDDLGVIRNASCPAILLELAFIDGPLVPDVEILRNRRGDMAQAMAKGIFEYLGYFPGNNPADDPAAPNIAPSAERFDTVDQLPDWGRPTIEKMLARGFLQGDGRGLDLSMDMLRIFVVHDRAGVY